MLNSTVFVEEPNFCGFSDRPKNDELRDGELTINILQDGKPAKEPDWLRIK